MFSHDICLNIALLMYWNAIFAHREQLVNNAMLHTNRKHVNFDYQVGQKVLKYDKMLKGKSIQKESFDILCVYSN